MEVDEIKESLVSTLENEQPHQPHTIYQLCDMIGTTEDFSVIISVAELEDEGRMKTFESLLRYREDGGAILLSRYILV